MEDGLSGQTGQIAVLLVAMELIPEKDLALTQYRNMAAATVVGQTLR